MNEADTCPHPAEAHDVDHEPGESVIVCLDCSKILYKIKRDYLGNKVMVGNWQDEIDIERPF